MRSIKQLFKIRKGRKEELLDEPSHESIRYIQIDDLRNDNNLKYCRVHSKNVVVNPNDIVIAWDGANAGTIGTGLKGAIGSTLSKLEPKNNEFCSNYIARYLTSKFRYLRDNCTGATIPHISKAVLENLEVPLPSLQTQKKMVEVLDKAQSLIDARNEQIKLLDDLIQSIFYDMFGDPVRNSKKWEINELKRLCDKIGSGATPRGGKSSYKDEGISLIRSMNVHIGFFKYDELAFIDDLQADKLNNVTVEQGDVLINITGASVARACIVPNKILPARVNQHVAILRPIFDKLNSYFLNYLLIDTNFQKTLMKIATSGGATREAITKEQLKELSVIIPPIELQNQFAEKVQKIKYQKQLMEKSLVELENNYNSLMKRAFKGELL